MSKRTKIPRASLAVSILDDDDYVEMMDSETGCMAFSLFVALVLEAKVQDNGGVFKKAGIVLCKQIKWESRLFKLSLDYLLNMSGKWVEKNPPDGITIRSFEKWNHGWGGVRDGSGRPPQKNQDYSSGNQDESSVNLDCQLDSASVSDSASVTDSGKRKTKGISWLSLAPQSLTDSPEFLEAWGTWEQHRTEIKKKLTKTSVKQQLKQLAELGPARAVETILHTVGKGWTGLREPDSTNTNGTLTETPEQIAARVSKLGKVTTP